MITIYGRDNCYYCKGATELLDSIGWKYSYLKVPDDISRDDFLDLIGPAVRPTVPQVYDGSKHIGGYSELKEYVENTLGGYGEGAL